MTESEQRDERIKTLNKLFEDLSNKRITLQQAFDRCLDNIQRKHIEDFYKRKFPERNWKPHVCWYWGPTGTGKSKTAKEEMPFAWVGGQSLVSWRGYEGHESIILDNIQCPPRYFPNLLAILDRYPYMVGNGRKSTPSSR